MIYELPKYPRTYHIHGSKGCIDKNSVPFPKCEGTRLIIEEKVDGSCVSVGFLNGEMYVHHRNTLATGPEFDLFKRFLKANEEELYCILDERYIMYGEWLYAKHTIFYDDLPSYFLEYDVYDRKESIFLSSDRRFGLFKNSSIQQVNQIASWENQVKLTLITYPHNITVTSQNDLSTYISKQQKTNFDLIGIDVGAEKAYTDLTGYAEGFYLKEENDDSVLGRYKLIRAGFVQKILESNHWTKRKLIPNQLSEFGRAEWQAALSGVGSMRHA